MILSEFGAREHYRDYVMAGLKRKLVSPFELAAGGRAYGGEEFVARVREMEKARRHRSEVSGRRALLRSEPRASTDLVEALVNERFADYSPCKRRQMLGYVLHRFTWMKNSEIAKVLNRTPAAVTLARARIAKRLPGDEELGRRLAEIEERLRSSVVKQVLPEGGQKDPARSVLDFKL